MPPRKSASTQTDGADIGRITLTGPQIASLFALSPGRITQLVQAGYIPKLGTNQYPLVGAVQGLLRYLRSERPGRAKGAAASRLQEAKARQVELANAEREGQLIELDESHAVMDHVLGLLKTGFSGLPARLSRDLTERRRTEDEINVIFLSATSALQQMAEQLETRGVVLNAEPEDDAGSMGG